MRSLALALLTTTAALSGAQAAGAPDWVAAGGKSARFPLEQFLTAYSFSDSSDALASAKVAAAADLAKSISVRVESQMTDLSEVKGNDERQQITALNKASTDVRLDGLIYETFVDGARAHALAILERGPAVAERRRLRDAAVAQVRASLAAGAVAEKNKKESEATRAYLAARTAVGEALQHESLARVIGRGPDATSVALETELAAASRTASEKVDALLHRPQSNLTEATEALAYQLRQQGISSKAKWTLAPFTYKSTIYPSLFGRAVSSDLERALAQQAASDAGGNDAELAFKGTYTEEADTVRIIVYAREVKSGRTVASAQASVPRKAIPADLPLTPPNLMQALRDQKILAAGEEVNGGLHLELFTNKQDAGGSQVFQAKEELKLFVRVNKPCYVRLVYLLQNGYKVPIAQSWFIKEGDVNKLVEFTDAFEIAPPFGSEIIQAAAFTDKPEALATKKIVVEGTEYDVVLDGTQALVKHRGFSRKKANAETADTFVTITTMPKVD